MNILLTNDDGIKAAGIKALLKSVSKEANVVVVAPADEKSASSHSISLGQKLRIKQFSLQGSRAFAVYGTPADCVKFAVSSIPDFIPDLIVSGINQGANTGVSVYYSGTISAAREGFINRIPSVAVSLASREFRDFSAAAAVACRLIRGYGAGIFPTQVMLNVNVPGLAEKDIKGIKITKQADSRFIEEFIPQKQRNGKKVYSLAGEIELLSPDGTSDEEAVAQGFVSITPLKLDLTDYEAMPIFRKWAANGKEMPHG